MLYAPIDSDGGVYVFSSCIIPENGRSDGTAGMMLLVTLVLPVQAAEKDELATVMRQLDQVRAALDRPERRPFRPRPMTGVIFFGLSACSG
ncbi:Uncharacterised protein [Escherichia coli]|uniref:Uncharacterized protein n=1 Tax=Escherichia coli TaxID=562 RepID=A0A376VWX3_ECOLX|nr:Uncharacterised protein [Escherichia coli]